MNLISRTITGIVMVIGGLFLISIPLIFRLKEGWFVAWIYGIPIFIIGGFILFNNREDKIEKVKSKRR